jgi:2-succinyl-5-enolpyruvyl-6-hydroxy-3-cyclohexene-1-carboxylate synthase
MPIRDVALTWAPTDRSVRIAANRGANGIDGLLSSAMGAAVAWEGPVVALCGDLSALHDLTALAAAARLEIPLTVVVVDNDGGGIFHFLPQREHPEYFERHFATPHGLDLAAAAGGLGVEATVIDDRPTLGAFVASPADRPRVAVVRTDREANVDVHRRIVRAVREAID